MREVVEPRFVSGSGSDQAPFWSGMSKTIRQSCAALADIAPRRHIGRCFLTACLPWRRLILRLRFENLFAENMRAVDTNILVRVGARRSRPSRDCRILYRAGCLVSDLVWRRLCGCSPSYVGWLWSRGYRDLGDRRVKVLGAQLTWQTWIALAVVFAWLSVAWLNGYIKAH